MANHRCQKKKRRGWYHLSSIRRSWVDQQSSKPLMPLIARRLRKRLCYRCRKIKIAWLVVASLRLSSSRNWSLWARRIARENINSLSSRASYSARDTCGTLSRLIAWLSYPCRRSEWDLGQDTIRSWVEQRGPLTTIAVVVALMVSWSPTQRLCCNNHARKRAKENSWTDLNCNQKLNFEILLWGFGVLELVSICNSLMYRPHIHDTIIIILLNQGD